MKFSQLYLSKIPNEEFLQLAKKVGNKNVSTGTHRLKLISDSMGYRINPRTNQREEVIWYHFEDVETSQKYKYAVPVYDKQKNLHYLIKRLGRLPEGTVVDLTYVEKGIQGYIDVKVVSLPKVSVAQSQPPDEMEILEEGKKIEADLENFDEDLANFEQ